MIIAALLRKLTKNWKVHELIQRDGDPYLVRYQLYRSNDGKDSWRIFLHRFMRSDYDRELHNHPWAWGLSLILSGGYLEERRDAYNDRVTTKIVWPGMLNTIVADTFHRVELLGDEECWSLIATGPIVQSWGFWDRYSKLYTPWRVFIAQKAGKPTVQA